MRLRTSVTSTNVSRPLGNVRTDSRGEERKISKYGRPSVIQPVGVDQGGSLKPYQRGLWRDDEQGGDTTPLSVSLPESFDRFSRPFKGGIVAQREGVIEIAFYFYLALNDDRESKRQYLK